MTNRTPTGIVLLVLAQGLAGCGGSGASSTPSAPSPVPQPTPTQLAVFTDPASGFSTSDVRDVQQQIVRFNTGADLIWTADGTRFHGYPVYDRFISAHRICSFCSFQVLFGTKDGEQRAYLTWGDDYNHYYSGTIVDIEVVGGQLAITETNVPVPGT
jgi:hypothetical protein